MNPLEGLDQEDFFAKSVKERPRERHDTVY